jgi:hypothetical protein
MSIIIQTVNDENVDVNGKRVYLDHNQNWVATVELTTQEKNAFNQHLNSKNKQKKPTSD